MELVPEALLGEMIEYYRARAPEYGQWWDREGRYNRGAGAKCQWLAEREMLYAALDGMDLRGQVLELAPGTGTWTHRLVRTAEHVAAVDASPEMIQINRAEVASDKVHYIQADLFTRRPDQIYDAVVFGFWVSHVPRERLADFFNMVAEALRPGGAVFFVDELRQPTSMAIDHVLPTQDQQVLTRKLNDGRSFQIVKNFYLPEQLEECCRAAGLAVRVETTPTYFYYGIGHRR